MGTYETKLKAIISQGRWETPHLGDLGAAVNILNRTMSLLAESPGWEGEAAKAAGEKWVELQKTFVKVADAVSEVQRVNSNANAALDRAAAAIGELPAGKVPSWIHDTVKAAEAGSMVFIPAMGVSVLASSAVGIFENFLGNQREQKASEASAVLQQELDEYSGQLHAIDWSNFSWKVPEPQPTPTPVPVPDPTIHVGGGGGYTLPSSPSYNVPAYPGGGSSTPGGGSSAPGIGGSFPSSPTYHSPSIDDGSVGTLPGYSGGAGGGFGGGGMGGAGGYGGGANSGLTAGVLGGAAAAGAAALRLGTGAGFGGGGMGGAGAGALAGGASGTGGLLGAGGAGQGGAGGAAGAGSGAGGAGAAGGSRGGMMGGQPMGGGAGAGKKDKRSGLGGLMAPKIEDDEPEFIPLPDGARAGGRDQL